MRWTEPLGSGSEFASRGFRTIRCRTCGRTVTTDRLLWMLSLAGCDWLWQALMLKMIRQVTLWHSISAGEILSSAQPLTVSFSASNDHIGCFVRSAPFCLATRCVCGEPRDCGTVAPLAGKWTRSSHDG